MLARIQKLIVLTLAVVVVGGALAAFALGRPAWALAPPLLIAGGYAAALGLEFFWLRASYADGSSDRPTLRQLLAAWLAESAVAPRVFLWRQPFRARATPDFIPAGARGRRGVVLVHGFFCNRGLWEPWIEKLRANGIPVVAVTLEPPFGSIDVYPDLIEAAVARLEAATGEAPILVGHSMGGLAIRAWRAIAGNARRVHRIVTIGTPHRGTAIARHARTRNGLEMQVGSGWLEKLEGAEGADAYRAFTCFWGHCDNIVFPTRGATLPGAENRHVAGTPHVAMAFHPEVFDYVVRAAETG
jgi:triacylglycerol lipase